MDIPNRIDQSLHKLGYPVSIREELTENVIRNIIRKRVSYAEFEKQQISKSKSINPDRIERQISTPKEIVSSSTTHTQVTQELSKTPEPTYKSKDQKTARKRAARRARVQSAPYTDRVITIHNAWGRKTHRFSARVDPYTDIKAHFPLFYGRQPYTKPSYVNVRANYARRIGKTARDLSWRPFAMSASRRIKGRTGFPTPKPTPILSTYQPNVSIPVPTLEQYKQYTASKFNQNKALLYHQEVNKVARNIGLKTGTPQLLLTYQPDIPIKPSPRSFTTDLKGLFSDVINTAKYFYANNDFIKNTKLFFHKNKWARGGVKGLIGLLAVNMGLGLVRKTFQSPAIPSEYDRGYDIISNYTTDYGSPLQLAKAAQKAIRPYHSTPRIAIRTNTNTIMRRNIALESSKHENAIRHTRY